MHDYNPKEIEQKWQKDWRDSSLYKTEDTSNKPKKYVLDMFPYPSGAGLHIGHPKGYVSTDVYSRMKRMQGFNVLHPIGWDAFGLPAENHALKNKVHPSIQTQANVDNYKKQLSVLGFDYDWDREINTTDPNYYKWTQWIFLKLFEKGLAYESHEPINWCPTCMTGLANEDLDPDGTCERCGSVVEQKPLRQWVLRITDYADRLVDDLETLDQWPEWVKEAQRNWIGRSYGAEIPFKIKDTNGELKVFTTRPDTLFGATYMVVAPEHNIIHTLESKISNIAEVKAYIQKSADKTMIERTDMTKEKTGVKLEGISAINPANQEEIPVYIADYVLAGYGTGAIMAVPAHDERDFAFAKKYGIDIRRVVEPLDINNGPHGDKFREDVEVVPRNNVVCVLRHPTEDKTLCVSWKNVEWKGFVTGGIEEGQTIEETALTEVREETGYQNVEVVNVYDDSIHALFYHVGKKVNRHAHYRVVELVLKDLEQVERTEEESAIHDLVWVDNNDVRDFPTRDDMKSAWDIVVGNGMPYTAQGELVQSGEFTGMQSEEAKTKITDFAGGEMKTSYKLRDWVFSRQRYWGEPIPLIHCEKCGVVPVPESELPLKLPEVESYEPTGTGESPLAGIDDWVNTKCPTCESGAKRETNTMPQWAGSSWYYLRYCDPHNADALISPESEKYWNPVDVYVGGDHATRHLIYARFWHKFLFDINVVSHLEPFMRLEYLGYVLGADGAKISKRLGNSEPLDEVVARLGADSFRTYEMFMGPFEKAVPWSGDGLVGVRRFIEKVWRIHDKIEEISNPTIDSIIHKTIKKVGEDIDTFKFNTAVAQMMSCVNELDKAKSVGKEQYAQFLQILAPFAPHVTEELWGMLGNTESIHISSWPQYDEALVVDASVTLGVQVNGKVRAEITVAADADEANVKEQVMAMEEVEKWIDGKEVKKFIYIPGKIISLVV